MRLINQNFQITTKSSSFINYPYDFKDINITKNKHFSKTDEFKLTFGSIHSVKGQTHCATLYIETDFHGSELDKLFHKDTISNPLLFVNQKRKGKSIVNYNKTLKMMYVGFSRPTHLLCLAIRKDKIKHDKELFEKVGWQVYDLSNQ